ALGVDHSPIEQNVDFPLPVALALRLEIRVTDLEAFERLPIDQELRLGPLAGNELDERLRVTDSDDRGDRAHPKRLLEGLACDRVEPDALEERGDRAVRGLRVFLVEAARFGVVFAGVRCD